MAIVTDYMSFSTQGDADVVDLTIEVGERLKASKIKNGIVTLSAIGSTGALTTCEYEPGLVKDIKEIFAKLIPQGVRYHHDATWGDGNGHAHLRASLVGPSLTIPIVQGDLVLGTWQQIIFVDFDNRRRQRKIVLQFMGK